MQLTTFNYISFLLSFIVVLGLTVHDTRVDKLVVETTYNTMPSSDFSSGLSKHLSAEQHIHINSFGASNLNAHQPAVQPKTESEKKYIASKRLKNNAFGNEYIWPSI